MNPGKRRGPADETGGPLNESLAAADDDHTLSQAPDVVRLRPGLHALYVRDTDPQSIACRRLTRGRKLTVEQAEAYEAWLSEQRQDAP